MGDLEEVDARQAAPDQGRFDRLLDVAREEHPLAAERAEEDDRDVVDRAAVVGRGHRDRARVGPEDAEAEVVDPESVAGLETIGPEMRVTQLGLERLVRGTGALHPGLEERPDAVAGEECRKAAGMVLVGVRQDDDVEAAIPRRDPRVERVEQRSGGRAAVDEES
ncbi:MAG TPA: hypothetical protein VFS32_06310 [Candidatus Limnocylindrales bacterium]|nr:hypothetical protein [Candidatus Limnocylindrales bacterium]